LDHVYFAVFHINFISTADILDLSFDFTVQFSLLYSKTGRASALYNFIHVPVLLIIPFIFINFVILLCVYIVFFLI
jgi:hypothetical protein